jgi:hypothetical protein
VLPSIDGFIAFAEPVDLSTGRRPSQPEFFDPLSRDSEIDFWHAFVKKCMFISLTSNRAPGGAVYINGSSGNWTLLEARIAAELEKKE